MLTKKILSNFKSLVELKCYPTTRAVLFNSFGGQYNDNPKYISEMLHKHAPQVTIYWTKSNKGRDTFPDYAKIVEMGSGEYQKLVNTAAVVVDNHTGLRSNICKKNKLATCFLLWLTNKKKRGQLNISTWHGTPLKKIGMDEPGNRNSCFYFCSTDYMLSGCSYTSIALRSAFGKDLKIKEYGTPRNDLLFKDNVSKDELKRKLGIPLNKKVLIYAPTFRNNPDISGFRQMESIDYLLLLRELEHKFGGEWCFVFRVHNLVLDKLNNTQLIKYGDSIINGNLHDDMAEYLFCSDLLLTDYSGSLFDFSLTKRICILYTPDLEEYANNERGFYMPISKLPFPIAKNFDEVIDAIRSFDEKKYKLEIDDFLKLLENKEDGHASERVVSDILSFLNFA